LFHEPLVKARRFFLGGRSMPWWLLGVSMVACTFSCDTPNLVTDFVRTGGVAKNWEWWAFLITGMVTVFIYAQLWRRSKVMTDLEFYGCVHSLVPFVVSRCCLQLPDYGIGYAGGDQDRPGYF
jgi:hypothetical protein